METQEEVGVCSILPNNDGDDVDIKEEEDDDDEEDSLNTSQETSLNSKDELLKPYECPQCSKRFIHKFDCHRHLQTHTAEKPFTCSQCGGKFRRKDDMFRHQRKHLHATAFSCHKCTAQFSRKFDLNRHLQLHDLGPVCKYCGGEFSEFSDLYKHIISHAEVKLKKLDLASETNCVEVVAEPEPPEDHAQIPSILKSFLEQHKPNLDDEPTAEPVRRRRGRPRLADSERRPVVARKQRNITKRKEKDLGDQIEWGDNEEEGRVKKRLKLKENQSFECLDCVKTFTHKADMQRHLRTHSNEKPFSCPQCGDDFRRKADMVRHLRTHMGEKPFGCPECCDEFSRKDDMVRHLRTHQGVKPYACIHCNKKFSRRPDMHKHMVTHASMKVKHSICRKCGFLKMDNDDTHRHTDDEEEEDDKMEGKRRKKKACRDFVYHQCKICKQPFRRKRDLTIHLKSHSLMDIVNIPKPNVAVTSVLKQDETIETPNPSNKAVREVCTIVYQSTPSTEQVQYAEALQVQEYDFVLISEEVEEGESATVAGEVPEHSASECDEKVTGDLPERSVSESDEKCCSTSSPEINKTKALGKEVEVKTCTKASLKKAAVQASESDNVSQNSESAVPKIVKCNQCGRPFNRNEDMNKHMQVHSGSTVSCSTCTKNFGQKTEYEMHCNIESIDLYACKSDSPVDEVVIAD